MRSPVRWHALFVAPLLPGVLAAPPARAICDVIPHSSQERHRGALGSVDRPFASPGEWVELSATPSCNHPNPAAFTDLSGDGRLEDEYRVMLVFEPPSTASRHVVVIAEDCTGVDAEIATQPGCGGASVASARCVEVNQANAQSALQTKTPASSPGELRLAVRLPRGTCSKGTEVEPVLCYRNQDCAAGASCDHARLERSLTGPLTIAALRKSEKPPCELVPETCVQARGKPGFGACLDTLYSGEDHCGTDPVTDVDPVFPNFTALPPPNDFARLCDDSGPYSPPCSPDATVKVRFALDGRGNMLVPMSWHGLLDGGQPPLTRMVKGSTAFPAREGGSRPIRVPDRSLLRAYTRDGVELPAIFQPELGMPDNELELFGLVDSSQSVLRIARRPGAARGFRHCDAASGNAGDVCRNDAQCRGGSCEALTRCLPTGPACSSDADCTPPNQCGVSAHDLVSRMQGGVGPVEIPRPGTTGRICNGGADDGKRCPTSGSCADGAPCVDYRAQALWHSPLHHTEVTDQLLVTVLSEVRLDQSFDANPAKDAMVALVYDRSDGAPLRIGAGTAPGRAVVSSTTTVGTRSFDFPVVTAAGPVVALLEDCAKQPTPECDGSAGEEARLRVYRYEGGEMKEVTTTAILPAPGDFVDRGRLAITPGGLVFYRARRGGTGSLVLHALEGRASPVKPPVAICPASLASVDGERIAFLRPEAEGGCGTGGPPQPVDLNADGDTGDTVVHQWTLQHGARNLRCGASQVVMRGGWIAAAVSEAQQNGSVLNGDGDALDEVLHVHPADGQSETCQGGDTGWKNAGQAAERIGVSNGAIAFITSESSQGTDLDRDGHEDDRVIQVVSAAPGAAPIPVNLEVAVQEFELGDPVSSACGRRHLLAFRTSSDGTSVLRTYDFQERAFGPTVGRGVKACDDMSCDPRRPYHVDGNVIRVLTDECAASGSSCERIEVYDVCRAGPSRKVLTLEQPAPAEKGAFFRRDPANVALGVGRCVEDLRQPCSPDSACDGAGVCRSVQGGARDARSCFADHGWCRRADDCPPNAECRPTLSLAYDGDEDDDGITNSLDLCPRVAGASQIDRDADGFGEACDRDDQNPSLH